MARKSQEHGDNMLTWAVGLMGAGLFALPTFLTATCGHLSLSLPLLASPWALGVVLALLGRVFGGLRRDVEDFYFVRKSNAVDVLLLKLLEASANPQGVSPQVFAGFGDSLLIIMNDKDPKVATLSRRMRYLHRVAEGAYYVSLLAFAVGIVDVFWAMWLCHPPSMFD